MDASRPEDRAKVLQERAEVASDVRQYSDAQSLAMESIALAPDCGDGYASLGRALLGQQKVAEAEAQFRRALALDATNTWYLRGTARCLQYQGKLTEALTMANTIVEIDPDVAISFSIRADILSCLGRHRTAQEDYSRARRLDPEFPDAHFGLGQTHLVLKDFPAAEASFRRVLAINPNSAPALNDLGVALEKQKKLKDAALAYKAAILVDPDLDVAKSNTKSVLDRYLGVGLGAAAAVAFVVAKIGDAASRTARIRDPAAFPVIGAILFGGMVAGITGYVVYRRISRKKRIDDLSAEDPQLLQIYETLKKHGSK